MRALRDADWMPPAHHAVLYVTDKLIGHGEVAFRIPAMIGFWVFSMCLFFFARRRVSILFALLATLLPYASSFQAYSFEARSYAFVLGFGGIALVSWQAAADGAGRPWSLAGLAAGTAGAVAFHYWAVLIYLPLAGAELYRTMRRRRMDWGGWAAFLAGGLAVFAFLYPILQGLENWSPHGAQVHARMYWNFYRIEFRVFYAFALPAAAEFAEAGVPIAAYGDFNIPGKTFLLYTARRYGDFRSMLISHGAAMDIVASSRRYRLVRMHVGRSSE